MDGITAFLVKATLMKFTCQASIFLQPILLYVFSPCGTLISMSMILKRSLYLTYFCRRSTNTHKIMSFLPLRNSWHGLLSAFCNHCSCMVSRSSHTLTLYSLAVKCKISGLNLSVPISPLYSNTTSQHVSSLKIGHGGYFYGILYQSAFLPPPK
jgi:hypothetical protein